MNVINTRGGKKERHTIRRRTALTTLAAATALSVAGFSVTATAQEVDTLTIVVPFGAGGTTDALARIFAEELRGEYASNIVVENKSGAGGRVGNEEAKNATPDGKTVLLTLDLTLTLYEHVFKSLPFKASDFAPVAQVGTANQALAVGPKVPASVQSLDDYMAWAAESPDNAFIAASGSGSGSFFISFMLAQAYGVDLEQINYAGDAPMATATLGGEVPATVQMLSGIIPHTEQEDGLRLLATGGAERSRFAPEIPTFKELGYDIKADLAAMFMFPAGTPANLVSALEEDVLEILEKPETAEAFGNFGFEVIPRTADQVAADLEKQTKDWAAVWDASGLEAKD